LVLLLSHYIKEMKYQYLNHLARKIANMLFLIATNSHQE